MNRLFVFLTGVMIAFAPSAGFAQIVINNTQTVEYYVQNVLLGSGVTVSNVTYNGMPANMVTEQVGSFACVNCNVGLPNGFMIATGDVQVAVGPNNSGSATLGGGINSNGSDPDLIAISSNFGINDWAIIEFDFVPAGDSIKFEYVWGSEEYMEYVNSNFNDLFGFFLSGPGISGPYSNGAVNIATIPGTNLPVTIDNVNLFTNGQYYVNNGDGFTPPFSTNPYYIQFDGFTVPLVARSAVQCGQTYHIKLACADSGDSSFDSAVFFKESSFGSDPVVSSSVPGAPSFLPPNTMLESCVNGIFSIFPPGSLQEEMVIVVEFSGSAENGVDYELVNTEITLTPGVTAEIVIVPLYDGEVEGIEEVTITYSFINNCGDPEVVSATMFIMDYEYSTIAQDDVWICPGVVTEVTPAVQSNAPPLIYSWSTGQTSPTVTFTSENAGDHEVSITDYCGNSASASFEVLVPAPFEALEFARVCIGTDSDPLVSGGALPYIYDYDEEALEFLSDPGIFSAIAPATSIVTVIDACDRVREISVLTEQCETIIPNIFTPNGKGPLENETFFIKGIDAFPGSGLIVFSRWGSIVFESADYANTWRGEDQPDGVYYYIFKRSDGKNFEGYVHMMR